jgi:uncharacterized protein (TIGR03382 family)
VISKISCIAESAIDRLSTVERSFGLAFTTLTIFAPLAQAAHPPQAVKPEGTASPLEFVATGVDPDAGVGSGTRPGTRPRGFGSARQVLPAPLVSGPRAESRTLYLNRDGAILRPGDNDSSRNRSSIVALPTLIDGWYVDDDTWAETVDCIAAIYAPFDVTITDEDPGDVPHIEAVIGGHPSAVGLPDDVGGVSPFTTDCAIVERSIVFTFTDVLPDDPRTVCEVTAQEIAHSFGLDHERLPSDPMTYLDYFGERTFQDTMASCGEFSDRACGVNGTMCRRRQNSVALLKERLGARGGANSADDDRPESNDAAGSGILGGCTAGGGSTGFAMALAYLGVLRRRRR